MATRNKAVAAVVDGEREEIEFLEKSTMDEIKEEHGELEFQLTKNKKTPKLVAADGFLAWCSRSLDPKDVAKKMSKYYVQRCRKVATGEEFYCITDGGVGEVLAVY